MTGLIALLICDLLDNSWRVPAEIYLGIFAVGVAFQWLATYDAVVALTRIYQFRVMLRRMTEDVRQDRKRKNQARSGYRTTVRRFRNVLLRKER